MVRHLVAGSLFLAMWTLSIASCDGTDPDALRIEPVKSVRATKIGPFTPTKSSDLYVVADLKLTNNTGESLSLAANHFYVQTDGGIEILGDPATEALSGGCASSSSLGDGASTQCRVAFSAPGTAVTKLIIYVTNSGTRYDAPLTTAPCGECDGDCKDFSSDPHNCGGCGYEVGNGDCKDGKPICWATSTLCSDLCVDLTNNNQHCGACDTPVPSGMSCQNGQPVCLTPGTEKCGGVCVDITSSGANCGACYKVCPESTANGKLSCHGVSGYSCPECGCNASVCTTAFYTTERISCDKVCSDNGMTCTVAEWAYGPTGHLCDGGTCAGVPPLNSQGETYLGANCQCKQ